MTGRLWDWRRFLWLLCLALGLAAAVVAVVILYPLVYELLAQASPERLAMRLLIGTEVTYCLVLAASLIGITVLSGVVYRARRVGIARPLAARGLLLSSACLMGLAFAEAGALAWRSSRHGVPSLPELDNVRRGRIAEPENDAEVTLVVLGESSAAGCPYESWLSVGRIVSWQLAEAIPGRRFGALVLAEPGDTLEGQCRKLARLRRRPDALIVYCGHNEFFAQVPWSRKVDHYRDDRPSLIRRFNELAGRTSPFCGLIQEAADKYQIQLVPSRFLKPPLVDAPAFTPAEFAAKLSRFRRCLEAIAVYGERVGALPILVVPPSNDAGFEPNRSFLPAQTTRAEREAFAREFMSARQLEASDPQCSIQRYRDLIDRQPGFAESHYRLARLLEDTGLYDEAYQHYVAARDLDGMPMRCLAQFQQAYRDVAALYDCALVDGQALFHALGPRGLLDDSLFHDAMHPSLRGHVALAKGILEALRARRSFGWPSGVPTPAIDAAECAVHFGLRPQDWKPLCERGYMFYYATAALRYDPSQRHAKKRAFEMAARQIARGERAEMVGLPNIGVPSSPAVSALGATRTRCPRNSPDGHPTAAEFRAHRQVVRLIARVLRLRVARPDDPVSP
jgi:hypothetical protein